MGTSVAPAAKGSKINVPPAPTVKLNPSGRAVLEASISVPAMTSVPPL